MSLPTFAPDRTIRFDYDPVVHKIAFPINHVGAHLPDAIAEAEYAHTDDNTIYVDGTTGNDTTGDGTQANPYATLLKSINEASEDRPRVVVLDSSLYSEDLSGADYTYFQGFYAAVGETPMYDGRVLGFTPADANTIFVAKTGSDSNDGTAASMVQTVDHALTLLSATRRYIILSDSERHEVNAFIAPANLAGIYAAVGHTPTVHFLHDLFVIGNTHLDDGLFYLKATMVERIAATVDTTYAACVLADGNTAMVYRRSAGTTDRLYVQIVEKDGTVVLDETEVLNYSYSLDDTTHALGRVFVAAYDDGKFVIVYKSYAYVGTTLARGVYLRRYNPDGTAYDGAWRAVTTDPESTAELGALLTLSNGNIVLAGRLERVFTPWDSVYFGFYIIDSDTLETVAKYDFDAGAYEPYCRGAALRRNPTGGFTCAVLMEDSDTEYGYERVRVATFTNAGALQGAVGSITVGHSGGVNLESSKIDLAVSSEGRVMVVFNDIYFTTCYLNASVWTDQGVAVLNSILIESIAGAGYRKNTQAVVGSTGKYFYVDYAIGGTHKLQYFTREGVKVLNVAEQVSEDAIDALVAIVEKDGDVVSLAKRTTGAVALTRIHTANIHCIISDHALTLDGILFDGDDDDNVGTVVCMTAAEKLKLKNVAIKDYSLPDGPTSSPEYLITTTGEIEAINSIFADANAAIKATSNAVGLDRCQFYRLSLAYALHIKGAGAGIGVQHCDFFNNYGSIRLESNDGNEVIKNNILHDNSNGAVLDTEVVHSNSVNTDSNTNLTDGASVISTNPLYKNEGAVNPDNTDLNIRTRVEGYPTDSPAYGLADDDLNAGAYDVRYIGTETTWSSITVPKPPEIKPYLTAVGNVFHAKSVQSTKVAQNLVVPMKWFGITNDDLEDLLDLWCCDSAEVRVYANPETAPDDFETFQLKYGKDISLATAYYPTQASGRQDIELEFERAYER